MRKVLHAVMVASLCGMIAVLGGCRDTPPGGGASDGISGFGKSEERTQVAFILNGPASDFGYNYAHDQGRLLVDNSLSGQIRTGVLEKIPETADSQRTMERLIDAGVDVIVTTSFGYQDSVETVAQRYPDVRFMQAWGFKRADNVGTYSAKMYEVWYLMGIVAGRKTQSNKLGIVAAHPIPPMKWQLNAYVLGAQSVNPEVTATVTFINDWSDPVLASQATQALINQGHDVVCGVLDSSIGVAQAAERNGAWLIGHNADLSSFAPTRHLVGTRWLWGKLYSDEIQAILDDTWKGGRETAGGLKEGYVGMTGFSSAVPGEVQQEVEVARKRIIDGEFAVYTGPIRDNSGTERIAKGKTLTHDEIMAIDWLVEGVR